MFFIELLFHRRIEFSPCSREAEDGSPTDPVLSIGRNALESNRCRSELYIEYLIRVLGAVGVVGAVGRAFEK